jgi:hypothetical protein
MGRFPIQGRGRGGYQGRGGRGRGFSRRTDNANVNKTANKKKGLSDYVYYLGSAKQASDYEITTEYIINYVKKTYEQSTDIATALKNLEEVDMTPMKPSLQVSLSSTAAVAALEDKQFEMEFKQDYDEYRKRVRAYDNNKIKAYALLWERCAKGMQNKIQSRSNFDSDIENDPIKLLRAIKEHALNYQENRYEMAIILDAMRAMTEAKQKENESLVDYTKRFKTSRDVFESHLGGPLIMTKYVKSLSGYDANNPVNNIPLEKESFQQLMAYLYMENADQDKYGSILVGLNTQKTLKNDQYPKTVTDANNVLSCHRFDANYKKQKPKKDYDKRPKPDDKGAKGDESPNLSFAQLEGKCYCCGEANHKSPECDKRDTIARKDWYINVMKKQGQSHAQVGSGDKQESPQDNNNENASTISSNNNNNNNDANKPRGWCGAHVAMQFFQADELKWCILLDNESTTSIFCNEKYVTNIRDANQTLELRTNGGILESSKYCDVPLIDNLQECWYNKDAVTNILSFHDVQKNYRVTYDNESRDVFTVHLSSTQQLEFKPLKNGLYVWKPKNYDVREYALLQLRDLPSLENEQGMSFVNTLEENKSFYTNREIARAKAAREYFHAMGTPSIPDLLAMIRMNLVKDCPITTEDVRLAEKIFGPDVGTIKGKTVRRTPAPVVKDEIDIPAELIQAQKNVTLDMDGLTVNTQKFLTTISRKLYYRTAHHVTSRTTESYKTAVDSLVGVYNHGGFILEEIHADNEFRPLMESLSQTHNIAMNFANPQEHVPRAERNNRVIKERVRSVYHRLPYERIPRIMVHYLVTESTKKLNFFPAKHGVSKYYSPRMIVNHESLDYSKHCKYSFGIYVQGHDEPDPSNTNAPRSLDCIYLAYNPNQQGGHILLHLPTGRRIIRRKVTPIPITPSIIRQVHRMAENEDMPEGLKISNRYGEVLFDSTWIAGVDYDEHEFDDDDYSTDDDDDDDSDFDEDDYDDDDFHIVDPNEATDVLEEQQQQPQPQPEPNPEPEGNDDSDDDDDSNDDDDNNGESNPSTAEEKRADEGSTTRSGRVSRAPSRMNLFHTADPDDSANQDGEIESTNQDGEIEYSRRSASVLAYVMNHVAEATPTEYTFLQTYSLNAGIKKFGQRGTDAADKEMRQLHDRKVFEPINVDELTNQERHRAMESLIFLVEKRDNTVKARTCANGSTQREYMDRDEAASPTASTDAILISAVIDAKQQRDVMTADVPNAFVQTPIDQTGEKVTMKIRGVLVDMLVKMNPELYRDHVIQHKHKGRAKGQKMIYVRMLKALYGMLVASLLYYKKFVADITTIGFESNPYDPCVANRIVNGKQHTLTWHVDDIKSSHEDPTVNDRFLVWLEKTYGEDGIGTVKVTRGPRHDYLAMMLDYTDPGKVTVDMIAYVTQMCLDFPFEIAEFDCPWTDKLFKVDEKSKPLEEERSKILHTFVMKGMFVSKRAR